MDVLSDGKPHNLVLSDDESKLFLTHSGPAAKRVTVLSLASPNQPEVVAHLNTDTNPFGLTFFRR